MNNPSAQSPPPLIALLCDEHGNITRSLEGATGKRSFAELVGEFDKEKAHRMLDKINQLGFVFDWELFLSDNGNPMKLYFAGLKGNSTILLVGARSRVQLIVALEAHLVVVPGQSAATLRNVKTLRHDIVSQTERSELLCDEFSNLLRELLTLHRDIAKKNFSIERLHEEKNRFLGIAAHDLRNPLQRIKLSAELLSHSAKASLRENEQQLLRMIVSTTESMSELLDNFLDISKIEAGKTDLKVRTTDLVRLCADRVSTNRILADQNKVTLQFKTGESALHAPVDANRINQALDNLVFNAIKHAPEGSTVEIELRRQYDEAIISVTDHGPGIAKDKLKELFAPFARLKGTGHKNGNGAGLGLYIARRMVEAHGGKIWAKSTPGIATTFSLSLPCNARARTAA